jgi:hypothetical protein
VQGEKLVNVLILQGLVCGLIALWGMAMLVIGVVWFNRTWMALGLAVVIVGLPFVFNALRNNGSPGRGLFSL